MIYCYCDGATKVVRNVTAEQLVPIPAGWVEIPVADGHDVAPHRAYWKLDGAGTGIVEDLQAIKTTLITALAADVNKFISERYNDGVKLSLLMLAIEGNLKGQTASRMPYLQTMFDWINDVLSLYESKKAAILALTTRAAVEGYDWTADLQAKAATDPAVQVEVTRGKTT